MIMNNLLSGSKYLIDGLQLIFKPGLKRFVIIPLLINFCLFIILFLTLNHFVHLFNVWFEGYLPAWLQWLGVILWIIFFLAFILIFLYTFVIIANLISSPFNGLLAEKVEFYLTGKKLSERTIFENIKDVPRIIGRQFAILGTYLPMAALILICFFLPIVQSVAAIIWFIFNAWYMTLLYVDFPSDNHRVPLRDVREKLKIKRWLVLGFGISISFMLMIPVLNFFVMPAAVAGATKLWLEEFTSEKPLS